jgi:hypothetical protein
LTGMTHLIKAGFDDRVVGRRGHEDCEPDRRSGNGREAYSAAVATPACTSPAFWRFGSTQSGRGK